MLRSAGGRMAAHASSMHNDLLPDMRARIDAIDGP